MNRATLQKRKNGFFYIYTQEGGRKVYRSTGTKNRREAERELAAFLDDAPRARRATFAAFVADFEEHNRTAHREKTCKAYRTAFRELSKAVDFARAMDSLTVRECDTFLASKCKGASAWTARKYRAAFLAAWKVAMKWGMATRNPWEKTDAPRIPERTPAFFTLEQFQAAGLESLRIGGEQLSAIVETAFYTGARLGEILALRWSDIDFERLTIDIRNSGTFTTKSGKERRIPMHGVLALTLASHSRTRRGELVFHRNGRTLRADSVSSAFKRACRAAGLPESLHFHSLRHSFGTLLIESGAPVYQVSKFLGHSGTDITERYYIHARVEDRHDLVNGLPAIGTGARALNVNLN